MGKISKGIKKGLEASKKAYNPFTQMVELRGIEPLTS
jgi:hypothetical protein